MIRDLAIGEGVAELLNYPTRCRMGCYLEVNDTSPLVIDSEPHVKKMERDRGHDEEVHRSDTGAVIVENRHPTLLLPFVTGLFWHVSRNGCEAYREAELPEFRMNLSSAPTVVECEAHNQLLDL